MFQLVFFLLLILFLFFTTPSFAARSISVSSEKSALFGDEDDEITITSSGFTEGETIYVKGAFFKDGNTNYFGYTKNNDNWVKNGETTTSQRQVVVGSWDNKLIIKSDFSDSGYLGEGEYSFKVGFYYTTTGGNLSSVNWSQNNLVFEISQPDPTPTPSPNISLPTPSPEAMQVKVGVSPTPTPSPKSIKSPSPLVLGESTNTAQGTPSVLESPALKISEAKTKQEGQKSQLPDTLVMAGLLISGFSLGTYLWYKERLKK